jgi:thioredoxin 1
MNTIEENDISSLKDKDCYMLFYFTASWCGPCQKIKPMIEKIAEGADPDKLEIYLIDIDENDEMASEFNIRSVPTFNLYKDKSLVSSCSGADIKKVQGLLKLMI